VSIEAWAVLVGVLALAVALLTWLWPKTPRRKRTPSFKGALGDSAQNVAFVDFLDQHASRRIWLDVCVPANAAQVESGSSWLAARSFVLRCGPETDPTDRHEIHVRIDDVKDSPLVYAHGQWTLKGYFAVEGLAGIWQGVEVRGLVPIPLAEVAE